MSKKGIMALALAAACTLGTKAQNIDYYTPGEGEGIAYFLPKTAVEINVIATRIKYTPGDFCQYANRYLRVNDVTSEPSTSWEIKRIEVSTAGVPDSTKAYIIKLNDKSVMSDIEITDNGIIKAINTSAPKSAKQNYILEKSQQPEDGRKYMTEEILSAGSTAKMAELTAKEIYNIRESKNLILRGQADTMPKDGESLKEATALRFSKKLGILPSDDLAGEPMYVKIDNSNPMQLYETEGDDDKKKKKAPRGIIYNIPGKGSVTITFGGKTIFEDSNMMFSQFGSTELLVKDLFNKKVNTRVIFDTATGGIQKIDKD